MDAPVRSPRPTPGQLALAEDLARGGAVHDNCGVPLIVSRDGAFHPKVETALA